MELKLKNSYLFCYTAHVYYKTLFECNRFMRFHLFSEGIDIQHIGSLSAGAGDTWAGRSGFLCHHVWSQKSDRPFPLWTMWDTNIRT